MSRLFSDLCATASCIECCGCETYERGRVDAIEEFLVKAMIKFYEFDVEHGYPTHNDVKDILLDVANELKGEQNE